MPDSTKYVWVPDEKNLFRKGLIVGEEGTKLKVRVEGTNEAVELDAAKTDKVNPEQFDEVGDMAELTYLNEPSVVNNLNQRWKNGKIYTYSGLFLVAVNPYRDLPAIYDSTSMAHFKNKRRDETDPHIYAIAEQAISNLRETKRDQSILITGESGAGKTENTKKAIQYLSSVANCTSGGIDERIIQTNPILEAFGNAQTIRNANSSRFGKFIKIHFDTSSDTIVGASIQWYLLEKSRVLTQHANERNYHIFYQLLSGAPPEVKVQLLLPENAEPKNFNYLASGAATIPGVNDSASYQKLVEAFKVMGFSDAEIFAVMSVVSSVLLLGQIKYKPTSADQGAVSNMLDVERVCELMGIEPQSFVNAVLNPKVKTGRREYVKQSRTADQALHTTNAIAKALYERLFGYIVFQLNLRLGEQQQSGIQTGNIGVLDIAGFEIFEQNSFEQLCINYTNEKLQQFFNHHMFVLEQEEYIKQKVDWEYVDYGADLQPTIDLIEQSTNPMGIFSCLNEESALLSGSDASFNSKLIDQWKGKNPKFEPSRLGQGFKIHHYAQPVEYQTEGWMEKNKDPLSDAAEIMLSQSTNQLIKSLFTSSAAVSVLGSSSTSTPASSAGSASSINTSPVKGKSMLFRTVAQKHKEQLNSLMTHLQATHPHFVRCILPNTVKSSQIFDNRLVLDQLKCNGVLEGIRIARSGFPNRVDFKDFCERYRALAGQMSAPLNSQHACATILQRINQDPSTYKVGLSKVFFKNGVLADLEHRLDRLVRDQTLLVQSIGRGALIREDCNRALHRMRAAKVLAKCFRVSLKNASDPWWTITSSFKPLLVSKEGMDNSKKDIRMQKLESSINRLREEQVELVSSRNELRAELIAALRAKEELIEEIVTVRKDQKTVNEEHEYAVNAARSRDEASTAALTQLSKQHSKLKDEYDELITMKEQLESEFEGKLKDESAKADERMLKFSIEQKDSLRAVESLLESAKKEVADQKEEIAALRAALQKSQSDTTLAVDEVAALKLKLSDVTNELNSQVERSTSAHTEMKKNLGELKQLNESLNADVESLSKAKGLDSKQIDELRSELEQKSKMLSSLQITHKKLTDAHTTSEEEVSHTKLLLKEKSEKLASVSLEVTKLREWLGKAKNEIKDAVSTTKELSALREAHKHSTEELEKKEVELTETKAYITNLKSLLSKAPTTDDVKRYQVQLHEANSELNLAKDKIEEYAAKARQLQDDLELANTKLLKSNDNLKDSQALLDKSRSEHMSTSAELEKALGSSKKANGDLTDLKAKYEDLTKKLKESTAKQSDLSLQVSRSVRSEDLASVRSELSASKSEVEKLNKIITSRVKREELTAVNAKLAEANAEVKKLKGQLANSVSAEKLGIATTELATAKTTIAKLTEESSKKVSKTELTTAFDRIKRLESDIDLANENLLKINDELVQSQQKTKTLQKKCEELSSRAPDMERELKESQSAKSKAIVELETLKRSASEARYLAQSTSKELETLKATSKRDAEKLKNVMEKNSILEKEAKRSNGEVSIKQKDVERLEQIIASFDSRFASTVAEKDKVIESLTTQLSVTKDELLRAQTQGTPNVPVNRKRFVSSDTEQQLVDSNHTVAELKATINMLSRDLETFRKDNAKHVVMAQKYEKAMNDKKMLVQELSRLRLDRGFKARETEISNAQDSHTKRLESEVKLLSLELARREKALKVMEMNNSPSEKPTSAPQHDAQLSADLTAMRKNLRLAELKNIQLEKQFKASQRNGNVILADRPEGEDRFSYAKTRSTNGFRDITNDRRVSGGGHSHGLPSKIDEAEKHETAVYRERANDYLKKLEKAEMVIESAVRGERSAKAQLEEMKMRLASHAVDTDNLHSEINRRDGIIKDLRNKAALSSQLDRELKISNNKLKEMNAERSRLSAEKSRLENRLHDLLATNDSISKKKDAQIVTLRQNEKQMLREHSELRWKLERKDRFVDQLRGSLADAEALSDELRVELERFKHQDIEKDVVVRRITRQLSEAKERYLTAERNLETAKSPRIPRDYNEPAFI